MGGERVNEAEAGCNRDNNSGGWREYQAVLTLYLGTIIRGYNMGFSSIAIPGIQLELAGNTTYVIPSVIASTEQLSWFASCVNIGQICGALLGGYFGSLIGPRKTIQISCIVGVLGWIFIATAPHLGLLILGRILAGIASATLAANTSLLVTQYSSNKRRGSFLALFVLMVSTGITLVYSLGAVLYWRIVAAVPVGIIIVLATGLSFVPESPIWLLGHEGDEETKRALEWLRDGGGVMIELEELKKTQENINSSIGIREALRNLSRPDIYKPLCLISMNFVLIELSGPFAIVFYAVQVFKEAGMDGNEYFAAILIGVIRLVSGSLAIFLIHRFSRTKLANFTFFIMALCMIGLGSVMYIRSNGGHSSGLQVLSIICVTLYMFAFSLGIGPLMWVYLGELMPPEYKVLSGLSVSIGTMAVFLVTKMFPTLLQVITPYGTYWLFAGVCIIGNVFYLTLMPDTKGISILEIRQIFLKN